MSPSSTAITGAETVACSRPLSGAERLAQEAGERALAEARAMPIQAENRKLKIESLLRVEDHKGRSR
jgi:hypothetical protein